MKRALIGVLLAVATGLLVLVGCARPTTNSAEKQVLRLSAQAPLATIDLAQATGYGQTGNVFEGFYRLGANGQPVAGLAQSGTVSPDGLTWTFTLRPNLKWSDGSVLTAQDFVYSWRRTITPATKSPYAYLFNGIKNATQINAGTAAPSTLGIRATDARTVVVTLDQPIAYFKVLMAYPLFAPQSEAAVTQYGKAYGTKAANMVYSGPFKVTGWTGTGDTWAFVKNPYYWDKQKVLLDQITYQVVENAATGLSLYQTGKLDMTPLAANQVPKYKTDPAFQAYPYAQVAWLAYNYAAKDSQVKAAVSNQDIRLAFSHALDRTALTQKALGNGSTVPLGFVASGLAKNPRTGVDFAKEATAPGTLNYAPGTARTLWLKGLAALGERQLTLELLVANDDALQNTAATYVKAQLEKELPGLTLNLRAVPGAMARQLQQSGDFDLALGSWGADFNDPISFLQIPLPTTSNNYGHFDDPAYTALVTKASTTDANDPTARWADLVQAATRFNATQGFTPLYQTVTAFLQQPSVKGIVHNTAGTQWSYKTAYVVQK
ncbi:peptide ABC transporter substrate-binding protein [Lacticaseibacillus daqingensis]|uniref:peptide ABC transporter substrate-binding protein n=1 Tax=Lacticaseibacillus daqingensis TaxID=2486014 RepID=UPI000F77C171|nr:peptide ABC transporter substrate-binding protein [Lacticaseibacillus daqingensis]